MSTATLTHAQSQSSTLFATVRHLFAGGFKAFRASANRPMSRQEEAAELRAIANDVARGDPRFAQDLYAAADRHELM